NGEREGAGGAARIGHLGEVVAVRRSDEGDPAPEVDVDSRILSAVVVKSRHVHARATAGGAVHSSGEARRVGFVVEHRDGVATAGDTGEEVTQRRPAADRV